jgi:hypothetical protein
MQRFVIPNYAQYTDNTKAMILDSESVDSAVDYLVELFEHLNQKYRSLVCTYRAICRQSYVFPTRHGRFTGMKPN